MNDWDTNPTSDEAKFMRMMANFADFGEWHFRKAAAYGCLPPLCATLRGANGHVEVWGGKAHRTEVWFIAKDKSETLLAMDCYDPNHPHYLSVRDDSLRTAIAQACSLAGVQQQLPGVEQDE